MAGLTYVNATSVTQSGTGAFTASSPSGTASGDQLFLLLRSGTGGTPTTPAGWTLAGGWSPTGSVTFVAFYRTATGSDSAAFASGQLSAPATSMAAYRNMGAPTLDSGGWNGVTGSTTVALPTLSLPSRSIAVAGFITNDQSGTTATVSSGYTKDTQVTPSAQGEMVWAHSTSPLSGATTPSASSFGGGVTFSWGQAFAVGVAGGLTMLV